MVYDMTHEGNDQSKFSIDESGFILDIFRELNSVMVAIDKRTARQDRKLFTYPKIKLKSLTMYHKCTKFSHSIKGQFQCYS